MHFKIFILLFRNNSCVFSHCQKYKHKSPSSKPSLEPLHKHQRSHVWVNQSFLTHTCTRITVTQQKASTPRLWRHCGDNIISQQHHGNADYSGNKHKSQAVPQWSRFSSAIASLRMVCGNFTFWLINMIGRPKRAVMAQRELQRVYSTGCKCVWKADTRAQPCTHAKFQTCFSEAVKWSHVLDIV